MGRNSRFAQQGKKIISVVLACTLVLSLVLMGGAYGYEEPVTEQENSTEQGSTTTPEDTSVPEGTEGEPSSEGNEEEGALDAQVDTSGTMELDEPLEIDVLEEESSTEVSPLASPFALFADVDLSSPSNEYTTSYAASDTTPAFLVVEESFSGTKSKQIAITLANGLALHADGLPGLVSDGSGGWRFDATKLPEYLDGKVVGATWIKGDPINGYQPGCGTLLYDLASDVDSVKISVGIVADNMFIKYQGKQTFGSGAAGSGNEFNAVSVISYYDGAVVNAAALERYSINNEGSWYFYPLTGIFRVLAAPGEEWELDNQFGYFANGWFRPTLHQEISFTLSMPKEAGLAGVKLAPTCSAKPEEVSVSSVDTTSSTTLDYITVTLAPTTDMSKFIYTMYGALDADAPQGSRYDSTCDATNSVVTRWDKTTVQPSVGGSSFPYIYVAEDATEVTLKDITVGVFAQEATSPAHARLLGLFNVQNLTSSSVTDTRFLLEFPTESVGVTEVRLMGGAKQGDIIKDIVATTTTGRIVKIAGANTNTAGDGGSRYAYVSFTGYLNEGEYIASVSYSSGEIPSGATTKTDMGEASGLAGMAYYGKLFASTGSYAATLSVLRSSSEEPNYEDLSTWQRAASASATSKVTTASPTMANIYSSGANCGKSSTLNAATGNTTTIAAEFGSGYYRYWSTIHSWQGFVTYVREAPGLYIDPSTIVATYNGVEYKPDSIEGYTDGTGCKVYKITMADIIFGYGTSGLGSYPSVKVSAQVRATSTASTSAVALSEVFFGRVLDATTATRYQAYAGTYKTIADIYGVTPNGSYYLVTPTEHATHTLTIVEDAKLSVATSASNGDNVWKTYVAGQDDTIVDLNSMLPAQYRLQVVNHLGQQIEPGAVILIPVPKAGGNTKEDRIQSEAFTWSLDLKKSVSVPDGYTVEYHIGSYQTDPEASTWVSSFGSSDNVYMIKITRTEAIPVGYEEKITIPLSTPNASEANSYGWSGKVNVFSALVNAKVLSSSATTASEPIALRLNTGLVSGKVMMDNDRDGNDSTGDTAVGGVTVNAYAPGTNTLLDTGVTNSRGEYRLASLNVSLVDLEFINPATSADPMRYISPITSEGNLKLTNVSSGPSQSSMDALLQRPWQVSFNVPVGVAPEKQYVYQDGLVSAPSQTPSALGYSFKGWYEEAAYQTEFEFASKQITNHTVVYGEFEALEYSIDYELNEGALDTGDTNPEEYTVADLPITFKAPLKTGHTFTGWQVAVKDGEQGKAVYTSSNTSLAAGTHGNLEATAVYSINAYTVSFNLNGSSSSQASYPAFDAEYNTSIAQNSAFPAGTPARQGYTFTGWALPGGGMLSSASLMPASDVVLTAQWQQNVVPPVPPVNPPVNPPVDPPIVTPPGTTDPDPEPETEEPPVVDQPRTTPATTTSNTGPAPEQPVQAEEPQTFLEGLSSIFSGETPLGGWDSKAYWSVLSLILVAAGLLMALAHLLFGIRKRKEDEQEAQGTRAYAGSREEGNYQRRDSSESRSRMTIPRIIAIAVCVLGLIFFVLLEDLTLAPAWINRWTVVFMGLFVLEIIITAVHVITGVTRGSKNEERARNSNN